MSNGQKNIPRRHHILPRLLLKRFAENDQVHVLDRVNRCSYRRSYCDTAFEKDYYSVETTGQAPPDCIETGILNRIETPAEPIIQNLLTLHRFPKGDDWVFMAVFLAFMHARGPTLRTIIKSVYELGAEVTSDHIYSSEEQWTSIIKEYSRNTDVSITSPYNKALLLRDKLKITVDIPRTHYVQRMLEVAMVLVPAFLEMTPNLEITDVVSDAEYAISDCPILAVPRSPFQVVGQRWFRNPNSDLFIPLSSRACLVLNYDGLAKVTTVKRQRVAFVNHWVACNSERVIISRKSDFVWRRENGTTSASHEELLGFLGEFTGAPGAMRVNKDQLRLKLSNALKRHKHETT